MSRSIAVAPMIHGRVGFDAVLLGDGTVLVVGDDHACFPGGAMPSSKRAELYDPETDRWAEMPSLNKPRKLAATVALRDGTAMVIGGINSDDVPYSSTRIFSPTTRTWRDGPLLQVARALPVATVLPDDRVLVVSWQGSRNRSTSETYEPRRGRWSTLVALDRGVEFDEMESILPVPASFEGEEIPGPEVLALGRRLTTSDENAHVQIYSSTLEEWGVSEPPPHDSRFANLVPLVDGGVILLGGASQGRSVQRLDPNLEAWSEGAPMSTERFQPTVVTLADGRILVAGGTGNKPGGREVALQTTEVYDASADRWSPGPDLLEPRQGGSGVLLQDGSVLILGGNAEFNTEGDTPWCPSPLNSTERLFVAP